MRLERARISVVNLTSEFGSIDEQPAGPSQAEISLRDSATAGLASAKSPNDGDLQGKDLKSGC